MEFSDYIYPDVTTIIITYNNSQNILFTMEKVLGQAYPSHEVIVVDAGSTDRTLEIINPFVDSQVRLVTVANYDPYEMLNKGISLAKGEYINFMSPGDFYLSENSTRKVMDLALEHHRPQLVFGASLLRIGYEEPKILYRPLSRKMLRQGKQPTTLMAMWFHRDFFKLVGKFDHQYQFRGEFDLLCKFMKKKGKTFASTSHVVSDFDFRYLHRDSALLHYKETFLIIYKHFGFRALVKWFIYQKDLYRAFVRYLNRAKKTILGK